MEIGQTVPAGRGGVLGGFRNFVVGIILIVIVLVTSFPFFWMVSTSLKSLREVNMFPPPVLPAVPQFENYVTAFTRAPLFKYGLNSTIICLSVMALTCSLALSAGYALVFLEFRGKKLIFQMLLAPQIVAGVAVLLPLFVVLKTLGLLNNRLALILPYTVMYSPFAVFLLRGYLGSVPKELAESARVDGAGDLRILVQIILPLVRPALAAIALFCFIWSWNEFLFSLIFVQAPELRTVSVGIAFLSSLPNFPRETNIILAAASAVTVPVLLLFVLMQRQFIGGITAGAVK